MFTTRKIAGFFCCAFLMLARDVHAFVPSTGIWWNSSESGRGFNIEIQDSIMTVTYFVYDSSGNATWYTSGGMYNESTATFTATLDGATQGQCFGCNYKAPIRTSNKGGAVSIFFTDYEHGTLFYPGGSTPIVRYSYAYPDRTSYLYGEWAFSFNIAGLIAGNWIIFNAPYTSTSGQVYASGYQTDRSTTTAALGQYDPSSNTWIVLTTDGSYTYYYVLRGDINRMFGKGDIEAGSGATTPNFIDQATASRILTQAEFKTGYAASEAKDLSDRTAEYEHLAGLLQARKASLIERYIGKSN